MVSVTSKEIMNEIYNEPQEVKDSEYIEPRHLKRIYPYHSQHRIAHNTVDDTIPSYTKVKKY